MGINTGMGVCGVKALAMALASNETVSVVRVGRNNCGDSGTVALANALWKNRRLLSIGLAANKIGAEGVSALAEALTEARGNNRTIVDINLNQNKKIGKGDARRLNALLERNLA